MRAVTLSDAKVEKFLDKYFVRGWMNIEGKAKYAGSSNKHLPSYAARTVSNGSGHHNVQMFFLTSDGKVLNALPGFWNPPHFLKEAELAVKLGQVYFTRGLSIVDRNEKYLDMHLEQAYAKFEECDHHGAVELLELHHEPGFDLLAACATAVGHVLQEPAHHRQRHQNNRNVSYGRTHRSLLVAGVLCVLSVLDSSLFSAFSAPLR
ncbi:MAG: hypothetical protein IH804_00935 [Planctomycetes bacterium]|nr:hypothetical protein [Planctomycetota bacterium]